MNAQDIRRIKRTQKPISALAKGKDSENKSWNESTDVVSYSINGAGLYLSRECPVGSLVSLLLALPPELRIYDQDRELYRVWGIVQHCSLNKGTLKYHVGVAFIGRTAPPGYRSNPRQTYKILGSAPDGFWIAEEASRTFVIRKCPRYWMTLKIILSVITEGSDFMTEEETLTENISLNGAAVLSALNVKVGQPIEFSFPDLEFSAIARICHIRQRDDDKKQLHLEFIDAELPVEKVIMPAVND